MQISTAKFIAGSNVLSSLPEFPLPEIAVIGRSNVGKSTFINRLTKNSKLARTSRTPGRTKEINLFEIQLSAGKAKRKKIILADLPGFGFAKLPKSERESLAKLTVDYISKRRSLEMVLLLNDSRRVPEEDELAVRDLAASSDRRVLVVLTKCDKLKQGELKQQGEKIARAFGLEYSDLLFTGERSETISFWERVMGVL